MKRWWILIGLGAIGVLPASSLADAQQRGSASRAPISARVDTIVRAYMAKNKVPGFSIAIAHDGQIVVKRAYGIADIENDVAVTTSSAFRTASIGKPMTATAVMQLWSAGKIDLDAPIQRYCPAFPVKPWPITSRQLLSHMSGIRDKTAAEETNYTHYESVGTSLRIFANDTLESRPGSTYHYSSYNYDVLGCVMEGATATPYLDYMQRHVFDVANMPDTHVDDPSAIIPHRVRGYVVNQAGVRMNSVHDDMSNRIPAGGFVSTPTDLVRFGTSVLSGQLVADSARKVMFTVSNVPSGSKAPEDGYALGWLIGHWNGALEVMHGGGTPQACAFLYAIPGEKLVISFMMNLESVPDRGELAGDLAVAVLGHGPGR